MKFDKSKVYTSLTADELNPGDKVIVADSLRVLRQEVEEDGYISTLKGVLKDCYIRRFAITNEWCLAYLVERAKNCTNCACFCDTPESEDKKIMVCKNWKSKTKQKAEMPELIALGNGQYAEKDCDNCGQRCDGYGKGELCSQWKSKAEPHYRPFKDTDELIKVWGSRCNEGKGYILNSLDMPLIWVRNKENNHEIMIDGFGTDYGRGYVKVENCWILLETLFEKYTFLDGSPCGVEE